MIISVGWQKISLWPQITAPSGVAGPVFFDAVRARVSIDGSYRFYEVNPLTGDATAAGAYPRTGRSSTSPCPSTRGNTPTPAGAGERELDQGKPAGGEPTYRVMLRL
ncbi:hypothetical protein ACFWP3_03040 [Streptomyces sp. NPDC058525]|uniref:hypothetical protein n=1 Tax=Streptomyces sp. NPDC058525 TaxID=3346538 RepID=UPI003666DE5F